MNRREPVVDAMAWDGSPPALLADVRDGWGDPEINVSKVIRTGIGVLDTITFGLMPAITPELKRVRGGDFWAISALEGHRKSTLLANMALHASRNTLGAWVGIESAEPNMSPGRYRDVLLAMLSTYYLIVDWHVSQGLPPEKAAEIRNWTLGPEEVTKLSSLPVGGLSADFLSFGRRTALQLKAIEWAKNTFAQLKLRVYGSMSEYGAAAHLKALEQRWQRDIYERNEWIKFVDHLQTIDVGRPGAHDYDRMQLICDFCQSMIQQHGICIVILSQIGQTAERLRAQGIMDEASARGGNRVAELADVSLRLTYDNPHWLSVRITKSRRSGKVAVQLPLEPGSGLIVGPGSVIVSKRLKKGASVNDRENSDELNNGV